MGAAICKHISVAQCSSCYTLVEQYRIPMCRPIAASVLLPFLTPLPPAFPFLAVPFVGMCHIQTVNLN
jgi:hypothetical protein